MKGNKWLGLVAGLLIGASANAVPVSHTLDITATDFVLQMGPADPLPMSPFRLDFSVLFDNAADVLGTTDGLSINSFNLPYAVEYAYNLAADTLIVATSAEPFGCTNSVSSFCVFISSFSSANPYVYLVQQSTASGGYWTAQSIASAVGQVPEPGSLALVALGLLGGSALRRKAGPARR